MSKRGSKWILAGVLLIAVAAGLLGYNLRAASAAERRAKEAAAQLLRQIPNDAESASDGAEAAYPDYVLNPEMDMPIREVDGVSYIGLLEIPTLGVQLPVQGEWSYPGMKLSPGRYAGSAYLHDLVICGHNYQSHFGRLDQLQAGDAVFFTDTDGNRFAYQVVEKEILAPTAVEEMVAGDWDLTLFTCTVGGASRVTIRCAMTDA